MGSIVFLVIKIQFISPQELTLAYGEHLTDSRCHEEAGLIYARAGQHALALDAFERGHSWRQCMCMAGALKYEQDKMVELSHRLVGECYMSRVRW